MPNPETQTPPAAVLLSIGDELVLGQTVDTNTAWLAQQLAQLGLMCLRHETVADDQQLIADAFRRAAHDTTRHGQGTGIVIASGGLGPTADDLTRFALADAMGVGLTLHDESLAHIESFFARINRPMPDGNKAQAMCPDGATMIRNEAGTAPGIHAQLQNTDLYVTPGVPREMKWMFEHAIEPAVRKLSSADGVTLDTIGTTTVHTFGLGASDAAAQLGDLMARDRNPTVGTTVANGLCSIRVRARFPEPRQAEQETKATIALIEERLGPACFGYDEDTLQAATIEALQTKQLTAATAESCTGGLLGSMLTDVPGSSSVFVGGWVTYANAMKTDQLGVPSEVIETHGAVSSQVAIAMARGARDQANADLAVSLTGVAGPDGGTDDKPVGTVWIGLATPDGEHAFLARLRGTRQTIRDRAAKCALQLIRFHALGHDPRTIQWLTHEPATS
ncbi:MAG: competence/damage-inducible protein A [Planctomycetota bacterium]